MVPATLPVLRYPSNLVPFSTLPPSTRPVFQTRMASRRHLRPPSNLHCANLRQGRLHTRHGVSYDWDVPRLKYGDKALASGVPSTNRTFKVHAHADQIPISWPSENGASIIQGTNRMGDAYRHATAGVGDDLPERSGTLNGCAMALREPLSPLCLMTRWQAQPFVRPLGGCVDHVLTVGSAGPASTWQLQGVKTTVQRRVQGAPELWQRD
ncbi:hypothetical protein EV363DRAFT_125519 [Boletus edulis]|nr:hypothetical protein EV363DRAFT_125519 [Boletus edulis]